jgi:hypothetical protein
VSTNPFSRPLRDALVFHAAVTARADFRCDQNSEQRATKRKGKKRLLASGNERSTHATPRARAAKPVLRIDSQRYFKGDMEPGADLGLWPLGPVQNPIYIQDPSSCLHLILRLK